MKAELEARLASLTTAEVPLSDSKAAYVNDVTQTDVRPINGTWTTPMDTFPASLASIDNQPSMAAPFVSIEAGTPGMFQSFDFSNLLMLPNKWPKNLPSPGESGVVSGGAHLKIFEANQPSYLRAPVCNLQWLPSTCTLG